MKYIYHHLGLGDHIICNGLVRYFKEKEEMLSLFCYKRNYNNVRYMYRDDENIILQPFDSENDIQTYINENKLSNQLIKIGFENLKGCETFDEAFYLNANVPFCMKFEKFYVKRDYDLEKKIIKELNPNNDRYIFTHSVDYNKIESNLKIIENPTQYNIFNLVSLIENAEEVHLMESSLKCLVNSYKMDKPKFFYHQYVRGYDSYGNTKGLNEFKII